MDSFPLRRNFHPRQALVIPQLNLNQQLMALPAEFTGKCQTSDWIVSSQDVIHEDALTSFDVDAMDWQLSKMDIDLPEAADLHIHQSSDFICHPKNHMPTDVLKFTLPRNYFKAQRKATKVVQTTFDDFPLFHQVKVPRSMALPVHSRGKCQTSDWIVSSQDGIHEDALTSFDVEAMDCQQSQHNLDQFLSKEIDPRENDHTSDYIYHPKNHMTTDVLKFTLPRNYFKAQRKATKVVQTTFDDFLLFHQVKVPHSMALPVQSRGKCQSSDWVVSSQDGIHEDALTLLRAIQTNLDQFLRKA